MRAKRGEDICKIQSTKVAYVCGGCEEKLKHILVRLEEVKEKGSRLQKGEDKTEKANNNRIIN